MLASSQIAARMDRRRRVVARRRRHIPAQRPPKPVELRYFRMLAQVLARARAMVVRRLVPLLPTIVAQAPKPDGVKTDAVDVNGVMEGIEEDFWRGLGAADLNALGDQIAQATEKFQRKELGKQIQPLMGVELDDVIGFEPDLKARIRDFTTENVALIKSLPSTYFSDIERQVIASVKEGKRWEDVAKDLEERYKVSERRANLIARDQVGKFHGQLNRARMTKLGITRYVWRTVKDNRVRSEHDERDGKIFSWDDPPEDGHPGIPIQCRCYPEPVLDELIAEKGEEPPKEEEPPEQPPPEEISAEAERKAREAAEEAALQALIAERARIAAEAERLARLQAEAQRQAAAARAAAEAAAKVSTLVPPAARAAEAASAKLAESRIPSRARAIATIERKKRETDEKIPRLQVEVAELTKKVDDYRAREAKLIEEVEKAEREHGFGSNAYRAAEQRLADVTDSQDRLDTFKTWRDKRADLDWSQLQSETWEREIGRVRTDPNADRRLDEWKTLQEEGRGRVRGAPEAIEGIEKEFPKTAAIMGGRLRVDAWNDDTRKLLREFEALPPTFLAAMKPHLGEFHITKGTIRGHGRFNGPLEDRGDRSKSYDNRTSWDQVGGVARLADTGQMEVLIADWQAKASNVVAHELAHIMDAVLRNKEDNEWDLGSSRDRKFQKLWKDFRGNSKASRRLLPNGEAPTHRLRSYFTNPDVGASETFAEAHAQFLTPDVTPEKLERLRKDWPELAKRGDGYLVTATQFGTPIADYVEDRVTKERWTEL